MNIYSTTEAPSKEFLKIALSKYGLDVANILGTQIPQEDALRISSKYPIFVVADGVTLIQYLIEKKEYPNPSPAGDAARIFCEAFTQAAEEHYQSLTAADIPKIFAKANSAVADFNAQKGRTSSTVDYWFNDFFAATAAFLILKDGIAYWGSICDSFIAHYDKEGTPLFMSPPAMSKKEGVSKKYEGDAHDMGARARHTWRENRNGIDQNSTLIGYGVITGETSAERYLNHGSFPISSGDLVFLFTDGFEHYFQSTDFISLFKEWPASIAETLKKYTTAKAASDPEHCGHERTLIAIGI